MSKCESSKRSVVSVRDPDGQRAGFGVYVGQGKILTCAHAVQQNGTFPSAVGIVFEAIGGEPLMAKILKAQPAKYTGQIWQSGDIALLELSSDPPSSAVAAPLVRQAPFPDRFLVFGHPLDNPNLTDVVGDIHISSPLTELRVTQGENIATEPGFSGSPVFDEDASQVIGLLRSGMVRKGDPVRQSYMLPVQVIVSEMPEVTEYLSNRYVRLSTAEVRRDQSDKLSDRIHGEWEKLRIKPEFDYRISAVENLDAIRELHTQGIVENYPATHLEGASYLRIPDLLGFLVRDRWPLPCRLLHLQAPGGSGKSVFVRDALQRALLYQIVPYCIDLKKSGDVPDGQYNFDGLFRGSLAGGQKGLIDDLDDGRLCLVVADGLNEISHSQAGEWLQFLASRVEDFPNLCVVVCDRIVDRADASASTQLLTIHPLSRRVIDTAMASAGAPPVTDEKEAHLLSTPFFLQLALSSGTLGGSAALTGRTRLSMFQQYFLDSLSLPIPDDAFKIDMKRLAEIAFNAYRSQDHLLIPDRIWTSEIPSRPSRGLQDQPRRDMERELKDKLESAGALFAVKSTPSENGHTVFRHQLLHDYLVGCYLARNISPDYDVLHGATWQGENPEPVDFAIEILGSGEADGFLNQVYDWNYSIAIGTIRDQEQSGQSTVSDYFKGAVAALIALKSADPFRATRIESERSLRIFNTGLARDCRYAVFPPPPGPEPDDVTKLRSLLDVVRNNFPAETAKLSTLVDYRLWKQLFCRAEGPVPGEETLLFRNNPLIGWTAANSFRRTGFQPFFLDRLKGAYFALRDTGVHITLGRTVHNSVARVARRRVVYVLGIAADAETAALLRHIVFVDPDEDEHVKNDALRSLLEVASANVGLRSEIVPWIEGGLTSLSLQLRKRLLKSHRLVKEDMDWRNHMARLLGRGSTQEPDERLRKEWESAKVKLAQDTGTSPS